VIHPPRGAVPARRPPGLDWATDGRDWPHREASRFVQAGGLRWHVQVLGAGHASAPVLLVHGTGSSSHSWRAVAPLLARGRPVIVPDLPGHAFSGPAPDGQADLPGMARALADLLDTMQVAPALLVGHSAGAAIVLRMVLDGRARPAAVASVNGALLPPSGWPGALFAPAARVLTHLPGVPQFFAWRASDRKVLQRLLDSTGSTLDADGVEGYARLVRSAGHAAGMLDMVTDWQLGPLWRDLPGLAVPLHLLASAGDRTVPPSQSDAAARHVPGARLTRWPRGGHLAHEEFPAETAAWLREALADAQAGRGSDG
jgi:magnesium chelatase accessory protein